MKIEQLLIDFEEEDFKNFLIKFLGFEDEDENEVGIYQLRKLNEILLKITTEINVKSNEDEISTKPLEISLENVNLETNGKCAVLGNISKSKLSKSINSVALYNQVASSDCILLKFIRCIQKRSILGRIILKNHFLYIIKSINPRNKDEIIDNLLEIDQFDLIHSLLCLINSLYRKNDFRLNGVLNHLLAKVLMKPKGIYYLQRVLGPHEYEKVVQLLQRPVDNQISKEIWLRNIINQIFTLEETFKMELLKLFMLKVPRGMQRIIIIPMIERLENLLVPIATVDSDDEDNIPELISQKKTYSKDNIQYDIDGREIFLSCHEFKDTLYKLSVLVTSFPCTQVLDKLEKILLPLFTILIYTESDHHEMYQQTKSLIKQIESLSDKKTFAKLFTEMLKHSVQYPQNTLQLHLNGIQVIASPKIQPLDVTFVIKYISEIQDSDLIGDIFINIFQLKVISEDADDDLAIYSTSLVLEYLQIFDSNLLKEKSQILGFIKTILIVRDVELNKLGLSLLRNITIPIPDEQTLIDVKLKAILDDINIILESFKNHQDPSIVMLSEFCKTELNTINNNESFIKFKEALKELGDEIIPIRAHGINTLVQMTLAKDRVIIEHLDAVLNIFLDMIEDSDSFIYLNAVKGVSSMVDAFPDESILKVTNRYKSSSFNIEGRTRIGEVLLRIIQRCGETFSKLSNLVLNSIFVVMKDEEPLVAVSGIVLMSVISLEYPLMIEQVIHQLFDFMLGNLENSTSNDLLKAVLLLLVNTLRGLHSNILKLIGYKNMERAKRVIEKLMIHNDRLISGHASQVFNVIKSLPL
jgi:hypothetical protein